MEAGLVFHMESENEKFDFTADLTRIGNQSEEVIKW